MTNELEKFKKENKITNPTIGKYYEMYKSYIPELEYNTFLILEKKGLLGKLFRGEEIKLIREKIFIEACWWRNETFNQSKQNAPCVLKELNPYWTAR